MMPAISVQNLSKCYKLGVISRKTLVDEVRYWWSKMRGRDPREYFTKVGHTTSEYRRIEAENTRNDYFWAIKDISFNVKQGEVVGIIGRNGAGKSTLLKILTRITEPTSGEAVINGRIGSLLEVGTGFHPELTGRENIFMNGTILGMKKREIDSKFDEIVAFSELDKFIDTPVKRYSSGMYVRLAFAVAAHLQPEILFIDEVLAVGDASFQKRCLNKMSEIGHEGRTILFVSHNMPAVLRLCSKAILLDEGQLQAFGETSSIIERYTQIISNEGSSRSWSELDAPGNEIVRLISISLVNENEKPISIVSVEDKLRLRIIYRVNTAGERFRCIAAFYTKGVCAFAGIEPTEKERPKQGDYCSVLHIPENLLAEGEYIVSVSIIASRGVKIRHIAVKNVISFHVNDPIRGTSARGDYTEGYAGILMPLMNWTMNYEGTC